MEGTKVFLLAALDDREEAGRATEAHRSGVGLPHYRLGLGLDGDAIALQAPAHVGSEGGVQVPERVGIGGDDGGALAPAGEEEGHVGGH